MKHVLDDMLVLVWMGWVSAVSWYYSMKAW